MCPSSGLWGGVYIYIHKMGGRVLNQLEDFEEKKDKERRRRDKEREATATTGPLSSTFRFLRKTP